MSVLSGMPDKFEDQPDLTGKTKPFFAEGQKVTFDFGTMKGTGVIRGLASRHIIDMWIVEIKTAEGLDRDYYPWSCIVMQHNIITPIG